MFDLDLIRGLEERCFNAWPTLRTLHMGGWVLRLADGHTRRANSASPLHDSTLSADEIIASVVRLFREAELTPIFRTTPLAPEGFDEKLAAEGWREDDLAWGMLCDDISAGGPSSDVAIEPKPSEAWLRDAMVAYGHGEAGERALRRTLAQLAMPGAFATVHADGKPLAWGLGVYERGYVGLYDLVVAPEARGKGVGRRLVSSLITWGRDQGAHAAYLQVRDSNHAARHLYRSFGFRDVYRYSNRALD
ncbi:GNAT family N-acetyltransferase [Methylovirgula sp. 4M-Z18]|uniref:GNAT family N-acetyltransferase n=1 Tax=Methylovirgula sp. 4M-Z18 TaxID=2293567 RepID=UPI0011C023BB|nr:GNAT family N-acetyltransferase [Methylovirgula sp. 4M-Z18]